MTQGAFAIKVKNDQEAANIIKAINSDAFQKILKSTKWGAFNIEWRMFKYFRKDFWKDFI